MADPYREVQRFRQPWLLVVVLVLASPAWVVFVMQVLLGRPVGTSPAPDAVVWVIVVVVGILLPALVLLGRMITTVDEEAVVIRWMPLGRTRIPRRRIRRAEVVTYRPIRDYGGWGIRWTPWAGWAWNVRGRRGVRLDLEDGRRVLVGSQDPEALAQALGR